ncbi:hypothetical protein O3P69_002837 [Scylla paramamosain]|uniref:Uncharacterized protein n=1 Tax=Scylla paramamosain TaxID=85552 RepID=A0AAW0UQR3_SCYPA
MRGAVVVVVILAAVVVVAALPPRNLTDPEVNPGCEECEEPWLVVTAGEGANNTLHHLWGAKETLSFLVVAGTGGPNVSVDWDALRNGTNRSVTFQSQPSHVFGFVIPSLILYNDPKDKGAFKDQNESLRVPVSDFTWSAEVLPRSPHQVAVKLQTTHFQDTPLPNKTRILMQVSAYGEDGRSSVLPHLLYTPNSAQLDLILDHFKLNLTEEANSWNKTRWGMDVVVFSSEHKAEEEDGDFGLKFHTQKSLDDEHTPGVFNVSLGMVCICFLQLCLTSISFDVARKLLLTRGKLYIQSTPLPHCHYTMRNVSFFYLFIYSFKVREQQKTEEKSSTEMSAPKERSKRIIPNLRINVLKPPS